MQLIEREIPVREMNVFAMHEMAFLKLLPGWLMDEVLEVLGVSGDVKRTNLPKLHNMHYYPAREPLAVARILNAAAALPADLSVQELLHIVGMEELKRRIEGEGRLYALFGVEPDRGAFRRKLGGRAPLLVDPMAGGGSIPLEAKRLGLRVVAGDLNPVAYLLLRASIEFPAKYGKQLFQLALEEAKKLLNYARRELAKYYPDDAKGIILVRGTVHTCGGVVPLVKTTALSKEEGKAKYYAFEFAGGSVKAKIQDKPYAPPAVCPHCGAPLSEQVLQRKWAEEHRKLIGDLLAGRPEGVEERIKRLYIPVAVQVRNGYREPNDVDLKLLIDAAKDLAQAKDALLVLPTAQIDRDNEVFRPMVQAGLTHWHHLFNPRQLLSLYKLLKYVRERAKELKEKHGELGAAVALYLALGISKMANYNNIATQWHSDQEVIGALVGSQYALKREVELGYDLVEAIPHSQNLPWAFETDVAESGKLHLTGGGLLPVLRWLAESLGGLWGEGDAIYLWDAAELDRNLPPKSVDVVHVDPPYYEQHNYTGVSEFFWQVLRSALEPVLDILFPPERVKLGWTPRSASLPKAREIRGPPGSGFGDKIERFFRATEAVLKEDGLFILWYTYGKVEGWEELFFRLYRAGFSAIKAWQVWTQAPQRRVALESSAFNTSIVVVAGPARRALIQGPDDPRFREAVYSEARKTADMLLERGLLGEAAVTAIANGLAASTRFEALDGTQIKGLMSAAISIAVDAFLDALAERHGVPKARSASLDPRSKLYLCMLVLSDGNLRVKYDIANRLAQVLGAQLDGLLFGKGETRELARPRDVAFGRHKLAICPVLEAIYRADDLCAKGMVRSAADVFKELNLGGFGEEEKALAKFVISAAGAKLDLKCSNLASLL
jgi:adenine-specific DNA methylase